MVTRGDIALICLILPMCSMVGKTSASEIDLFDEAEGENSSTLDMGDVAFSTTDANNNTTYENDDLLSNVTDPMTTQRRRYTPFPGLIAFGFVFATIVTVTGFFGSALTVIILARGALKSSASVYMIALAISDCLFVIFTWPNFMNSSDSIKYSATWKMVYAYYDVYLSESTYIIHSWGIWITICLAIERFIAVCYPMKLHLIAKKSRAKLTVMLLLVLMALLSGSRYWRRYVSVRSDPITHQTIYVKVVTPLGKSATYTAGIYWSYALISIIIPFPTLTIFNSIIVYNLRKLTQQRKLLTLKSDSSGGQSSNSRDNQITRILIGVVVSFLICNLVTAIRHVHVAILGPGIYNTNFLYVTIWVGALLEICNPTANFVLYMCCSKAMREALIDLITAPCRGFSSDKKIKSNTTGKSPVSLSATAR